MNYVWASVLRFSAIIWMILFLGSCSSGGDDNKALCECIKDLDALDAQMREEGSSRELANAFKKRMANCAKVMKDYKPEKKEEILKNCE